MSSAAGLPRPLRRRASLVTTALDRLPVEMAKKALLETLTATGGEPKDERVVVTTRPASSKSKVSKFVARRRSSYVAVSSPARAHST